MTMSDIYEIAFFLLCCAEYVIFGSASIQYSIMILISRVLCDRTGVIPPVPHRHAVRDSRGDEPPTRITRLSTVIVIRNRSASESVSLTDVSSLASSSHTMRIANGYACGMVLRRTFCVRQCATKLCTVRTSCTLQRRNSAMFVFDATVAVRNTDAVMMNGEYEMVNRTRI